MLVDLLFFSSLFSFLFCFICSLVGVDGRIRAKLSSFGKAALRQKQVWFVCSGCDVFDLVEPVQGELPRCTEPSFYVCARCDFSLSFVTLSLSHSLSLSHVKLKLYVRGSFIDQRPRRGTGKAWTQGYEDVFEDARQAAQGQSKSMCYKLIQTDRLTTCIL